MGEIIPFYNPCQTCGNEDICLHDDVEHKISIAGGIRALCYKCGRNTKPQVWNDFNDGQDDNTAPEPIAV